VTARANPVVLMRSACDWTEDAFVDHFMDFIDTRGKYATGVGAGAGVGVGEGVDETGLKLREICGRDVDWLLLAYFGSVHEDTPAVWLLEVAGVCPGWALDGVLAVTVLKKWRSAGIGCRVEAGTTAAAIRSAFGGFGARGEELTECEADKVSSWLTVLAWEVLDAEGVLCEWYRRGCDDARRRVSHGEFVFKGF
jgi:hypothetical protein